MRVVFTEQSLISLEEAVTFLLEELEISPLKVSNIISGLLDAAETLSDYPYSGQVEEYLVHLDLGHRRIIRGYFKIIYRIMEDQILITDFFDSRQDPDKMKG